MERSPVWTPHNRAMLAERIGQGVRTSAACRQLGISTNTYYRWLRHGRALRAMEAQGHALTPDELIYVTFAQWIELARSRS